jgi:uncharacterized BrkB/YihY/UPF0761 family membrane protein
MDQALVAISVLLVFLSFMLQGLQRELDEKIHARVPEAEQTEARRTWRSALLALLWTRMVPTTLAFLAAFYTLLPSAVQILTKSSPSLWHFNALDTIFVFVELGLLGLVIYSGTICIRIVRRLRR